MKRQEGFTLTEMLVVSAIVAILLSVAIPSYKYITTSYRMSAEINSLLGDLQFARAEALKEGNGVTTCVSTDGKTCTGGTNWQQGWIVFSDQNSDQQVDGTDLVLKVQSVFSGTTPDTFVPITNTTAITYNREGFANTVGGFGPTTMLLQDPTLNLTYRRCLQIAGAGMLSAESHVANPTTC
jgi:type IV fimbrial biogenesis protein FimT